MPSDPRDYRLDVAGVTPPSSAAARETAPSGRPYLSVRFDCCGVYRRVYRDPDGRRYRGRCPRCARPVTFAVGDGGTAARFFVVS